MKLDDVISALWLGGIAIAFIVSCLSVGYLVYTGDIIVTGSISVSHVFNAIVVPIVLLMTGLAVLDVYGKRRVKTLIDIIKNNR